MLINKMIDEQTKQELKEFIFLAHQNGKKETSGLVGDMKTSIALLQEKQHNMDEKLDIIVSQTTKTNGSVIGLKMWRSYNAGAIAIIILIVIPLIVFIFGYSLQIIQEQINEIKRQHDEMAKKI